MEARWQAARNAMANYPYECSSCGWPAGFNPPPKCPCCGAEMYGATGRPADTEEMVKAVRKALPQLVKPARISMEMDGDGVLVTQVRGELKTIGFMILAAFNAIERDHPECGPFIKAACRAYLEE